MHSLEKPDELEIAFLAGAVAALRKRAESLRANAAPGIVKTGDVTVVTSEARHTLNIACDLEAIATELGGGA